MIHDSHKSLRCGIVLAAGEGERLRPFVRRLRGDTLPKQYVNFIGARSMLEHTFCRAERVISPERLFTVVSQEHLRHPEVEEQLSGRAGSTVIVQPENKETGPGILLPLMHLYKRYPDSAVAVFPSDHFIVEEALFMAHVDLAYHVVERHPRCLVLLGMEPRYAELEYGYILPGARVQPPAPLAIHEVHRFIEKPRLQVARELLQEGGLWNTMVMVFRVETLLELVRTTAPLLYRLFKRILEAIGTVNEMRVVEAVYRHMETVNFSRGLLEPLSLGHATRLLVVPVPGVFWSDWGSEERIWKALSKSGLPAQLPGTGAHRLPGVLDHHRNST
ncbi:MAG: NTP transferase domain-containing protein [Deltaproteobacteria bacterium]|nr:NTP transferase domain-containing protein [Deltaproteobacteria bacterium]